MRRRRGRSQPTPAPSRLEEWILGRGTGAPIVRFSMVWGSVGPLWVILSFASGLSVAPPPDWIPFPLDAFWQTIAMFFSAPVLVTFIPVVAALWLGFRLAPHYLADLFEPEAPSLASRHLWPALFGLDILSYPRLDVTTGNIEQLDPVSPLVASGGPGYLKIPLGHAVVVESLEGRPKVYGPARLRFLSGFERIRDVVDLRDQVGRVDMVRAITRDGIEVQARDAHMVFRVDRGEGKGRSREDPYPFDEASIRHLVYARAVEEGGRRRWADALPERVRSEIRSFVERSTLDQFLALRPQAEQAVPSPASRERQQARGFREALGSALHELLESWRSDGQGHDPQLASLLLLRRIQERLARLRDLARGENQLRLPVNFDEAMRHLASLAEPRWLGGGPS